MSKRTPNLDLYKPDLTDVADITAMNQNWDKIDGMITYGTEDLTAGSSELDTGKLYFVYE